MPLHCQTPPRPPLKKTVNLPIRSLTFSVWLLALSGCGTVVAVADAVGTATVYTVKTTVNTLDAVTPDIVNDDDDD